MTVALPGRQASGDASAGLFSETSEEKEKLSGCCFGASQYSPRIAPEKLKTCQK